jgi:RiboL-PSP-HEPN
MSLRKVVAKELKEAAHELSPWELAGDGWKSYVLSRLSRLEFERNRSLNTPRTGNIDALFAESIGLFNLSTAWYWNAMSVERASAKLDAYIELRGAIAHRGAVSGVTRDGVGDFLNHVERLVAKTDARVSKFATAESGTPLYK